MAARPHPHRSLARRPLDTTPGTESGDLTAALESAVAAAHQSAPGAPIEAVLGLLAAAPVGAWLPLEVLTTATDNAAKNDQSDSTADVDRIGPVQVRDP